MSEAVFFALMKMTGMSRNSSFFFTARQSSNPSIQLIITSRRMRSGRSTWSVEMRRSPLAAWATSYPSNSSAIFSISRVSRSSSTMMIFLRALAISVASPPRRGRAPSCAIFCLESLTLASRGDDLGLQLALVQPDADPIARVCLGGILENVPAGVESDRVAAGKDAQRAQRIEASGETFEAVAAAGERSPGEELESLLELSDVPRQTM